MGLPASGKTTLARALAGRLGLVHLSSDMARKRMAGIEPTQRGSDEFGSGLYDPAMTRSTYAALRRDAARWLRRGRGVAVDATFGNPRERAQMRQLAHRLGADLRVVLCDADDATPDRATSSGAPRRRALSRMRGSSCGPSCAPHSRHPTSNRPFCGSMRRATARRPSSRRWRCCALPTANGAVACHGVLARRRWPASAPERPASTPCWRARAPRRR